MTENAKKLPCGHIFHQSCLRSCLEHHHFCPTCRYSLIENQPGTTNWKCSKRTFSIQWSKVVQLAAKFSSAEKFGNGNNVNNLGFAYGQGQTFDMGFGLGVPPEMVQQVREIFPDVPQQDIVRDLLQTRSAELTIENIVEGRLVYQPVRTPPVNTNIGSPATTSSSFQTTNASPQQSSQVNSVQQQTQRTDQEVKSFPGTFSTSAKDRHSSLVARKQALMEQARKQYLEKQQQDSTPTQEFSNSETPATNDNETRRKVLL
eukprot:CAMPEP_0168555616 /NCGR_PEP_ID=MMETSP0413-20121227/8435_1 /TAXON_ID=136452 /ORGANISM="Filamoeba nolandi, Strain NC-AS-23-1" /LENGTH=259 /DNA_ID=CAMNT_0008586489 /DNA_START=836 /DNA_END=1613 /DNA_ORIENTATION=+